MNTLSDLNDYLFDQLNRITNDDLQGEELRDEIKRTHAVCSVAENIVKNASVQLRAIEHADEMGIRHKENMPALLIGE